MNSPLDWLRGQRLLWPRPRKMLNRELEMDLNAALERGPGSGYLHAASGLSRGVPGLC